MDSSASSAFLDRLGMSAPIIQAPMAGVSTPAMAAAVSNAGGLGSLGVGAMAPSAAAEAIGAFRERSSGPLNVNVFCHRPAVRDPEREAAWLDALRPAFDEIGAPVPAGLTEIYKSFVVDREMLRTIVAARPEVVSFHFGLPDEAAIKALREAGCCLMGTATTLDEAKALVRGGVQVVVAQGYEAGGHRGMFDPDARDDCLGTLALTRLLVRALDGPVVAAGGIMDGAGIGAALCLGAAAVQLGTAFVGCTESLADEHYRALLFGDAARHTVMTRAISGRPARCIANRFTAFERRHPTVGVPSYPVAYDAAKTLAAAARDKGEHGYGAHWAGQGVPLARSLPAGVLVRRLIEELAADAR
ncbi:nitronate monooxygenase [Kaustia mangrovi]|uniref:Nitronate monooxygenase n=1 Tax=Kaustia mangrovi TaxID=2593653 RepID=A0A7S8C6Y0_9HYPH|nr:nitronate monooxygenase [Kaustia mangrovi]QPC44545.1 nitronate monooxygenase [Kaustia mangrovi]